MSKAAAARALRVRTLGVVLTVCPGAPTCAPGTARTCFLGHARPTRDQNGERKTPTRVGARRAAEAAPWGAERRQTLTGTIGTARGPPDVGRLSLDPSELRPGRRPNGAEDNAGEAFHDRRDPEAIEGDENL